MIKKWSVLILILLLASVVYLEASKQNVVIEIEGMNCKLCPLAVKNSLSNIEGVRDVEVSLEKKKAWLTVKESVSNETLIDAVKKAGPYKGRVIERRLKE